MRRLLALLGLSGLLLAAALVAGSFGGGAAGASGVRSFTFAAAGDHGADRLTSRALTRLDASRARFYLALGDLSYGQRTDSGWCRYVHRHLSHKGSRFPFELLVGNHEEQGGPDGHITAMARCLPDRLHADTGTRGRYAAQYAFSFPRRNPYARFIMIAPGMRVAGRSYRYRSGSPDRAWVSQQIDRARRHGIRWVIVGMHYPCLSTGQHGCTPNADAMNLLVRKRVDLVLTAHNHVYERSRQLRFTRTCRALHPGHYDRGCVSDTGADHQYRQGRGVVQITAGTIGGTEQGLRRGDPDAGFFARTNGTTTGFERYRVTPFSISGSFVRTSGRFSDWFTIRR